MKNTMAFKAEAMLSSVGFSSDQIYKRHEMPVEITPQMASVLDAFHKFSESACRGRFVLKQGEANYIGIDNLVEYRVSDCFSSRAGAMLWCVDYSIPDYKIREMEYIEPTTVEYLLSEKMHGHEELSKNNIGNMSDNAQAAVAETPFGENDLDQMDLVSAR